MTIKSQNPINSQHAWPSKIKIIYFHISYAVWFQFDMWVITQPNANNVQMSNILKPLFVDDLFYLNYIII